MAHRRSPILTYAIRPFFEGICYHLELKQRKMPMKLSAGSWESRHSKEAGVMQTWSQFSRSPDLCGLVDEQDGMSTRV
jgi:hypothetical protein